MIIGFAKLHRYRYITQIPLYFSVQLQNIFSGRSVRSATDNSPGHRAWNHQKQPRAQDWRPPWFLPLNVHRPRVPRKDQLSALLWQDPICQCDSLQFLPVGRHHPKGEVQTPNSQQHTLAAITGDRLLRLPYKQQDETALNKSQALKSWPVVTAKLFSPSPILHASFLPEYLTVCHWCKLHRCTARTYEPRELLLIPEFPEASHGIPTSAPSLSSSLCPLSSGTWHRILICPAPS